MREMMSRGTTSGLRKKCEAFKSFTVTINIGHFHGISLDLIIKYDSQWIGLREHLQDLFFIESVAFRHRCSLEARGNK